VLMSATLTDDHLGERPRSPMLHEDDLVLLIITNNKYILIIII